METLSVCMMVQNREKLLPIALESLGGLYDELIVVDGGSTDRTCEVCAAYGAKIIHSAWQDHHANQRNVYLAAVETDWVFAIDSDEFIDKYTLYFLHLLKLRGDRFAPSLFFLPRRWISPTDLRQYITSSPHYPDAQARIFRPDGLSYKGRIHSIPTGAPRTTQLIRELGLYHLDLLIHSEEQRQQKVERYAVESPQDGAAEYYLPDVDTLELAPWSLDEILPEVQQQLRSLDPTLPEPVGQIGDFAAEPDDGLPAEAAWILLPDWRRFGEYQFFELVEAFRGVARSLVLPTQLLIYAGAADSRFVKTALTNATTALLLDHGVSLPHHLKLSVVGPLNASLKARLLSLLPTKLQLKQEDLEAIALLEADRFPTQTLAELIR